MVIQRQLEAFSSWKDLSRDYIISRLWELLYIKLTVAILTVIFIGKAIVMILMVLINATTLPVESYRVSICVWSRNPENGGQRSILGYKRLWMYELMQHV
jgi:hypothetical protein